MTQADKVRQTFHRSVMLCVCLSAIVLASAEDVWFPSCVTPVFACLSYLIVDRRTLALPVSGANVLGAIATIVVAIEFYNGTVYEKLLSGAHMLVYLTWIILLMRKGHRQFWWLCALCVLQLAVASVMTQKPSFGASLIGMLFVLIWTLSVFTLYRSQQHLDSVPEFVVDSLQTTPVSAHEDSLITVHNGIQKDARERWIGWAFRWMVAWTACGSLIVALISFAVFPRYFVKGMAFTPLVENSSGIRSRTGFNDNIQLGQVRFTAAQ